MRVIQAMRFFLFKFYLSPCFRIFSYFPGLYELRFITLWRSRDRTAAYCKWKCKYTR